MLTKIINIDITSDFACPWCYVGERRLAKAIQQFKTTNPAIEIKIRYFPYMIDSSISPKGEQYMEYNTKRWGGDSWAVQMKQSVLKEGILFKGWAFWPNTLLLHTLMLYGEQQKKEENIYEDGICACDLGELQKTAKEAGLDGNQAMQFINQQENQNEVKKQDRKAKDKGIDGVPYFVISYGQKVEELGGAQKSEYFKSILTKLIQ